MASIRAYRTSRGDRRYEVRFRDQHGLERSRAFSTHKDAQAYRLDVERRRQAGLLYQAAPERFGEAAKAWLERYQRGAAGRVRPRPRSIVLAHENLAKLAPLFELAVERIRRPMVEDLISDVAATAPRRAEMCLALLKRILRSAEQRGQQVDPGVYAVRIAKHEEREPALPDLGAGRRPPLLDARVRRPRSSRSRSSRCCAAANCSLCATRTSTSTRRPSASWRSTNRADAGGPRREQAGAPSTSARRSLRLLREQQLTRPAAVGGLLFPTSGGHAWDPNNFMRRVFKPAAAAIGVADLTFHDLRHTGASLMIAAGCNVKVIAEQMGHADGGALVLHRYGHLYSGARRHAALALERHLFAGATDDEGPVGTVWDDAQQAWDFG